MKKLISLLLAFMILLALTACRQSVPAIAPETQASSETAAQSAQGTIDAAAQVVTVVNGNRTLEFDFVPQRVVCLNMQMTEMMLKLGLGEKVIYTCYTNAAPIPDIKVEFEQIPLLSEKYPTTEVLVGAEPDLVLGQRFGFTDEKAGSVETLASHGIMAYVSEGTLATEEKVENIYADLEDLGRIFRVEDRATILIQEMQDKIDSIAQKLADVTEEDRVKVFVVDSFKENEIFTSAKSMETEVIKLAGGINVCENDSDEQWYYTSTETLIDKNPDVILCNTYSSVKAEDTIAAIKANPALANVSAVKNNRFIITDLQDVNESVRVADTAIRFAQELYPEIFG